MSLADRVDAVHAEFRRRSASALGGEVHDDHGVLLWAGPNDEAIVVNGALRTSAQVSAGDLFARAERFFGARSRGHTMFCRTDVDRDVLEVCRSRGLPALAEGGLPEMVVHARVTVPAVPDGVSIRQVRTTSERDDVGAFVVDLDGAPAAVAMSVVIDGVADIHWVGTMPFASRRGLGELATAKSIEYGFDHGADVAALQASPMGDGLYRRMGFVELYRYEEFLVFAT